MMLPWSKKETPVTEVLPKQEQFSFAGRIIASAIAASEQKRYDVIQGIQLRMEPLVVYSSEPLTPKIKRLGQNQLVCSFSGLNWNQHKNKLEFRLEVSFGNLKDTILLESSPNGFYIREFLNSGVYKGSGLGKIIFNSIVMPILRTANQNYPIGVIQVIPSDYTQKTKFYDKLGFVGEPNNPYGDKTMTMKL